MRPLCDSFRLIPERLPPRPRVLLTAGQVERARRFAETYAWAREGKEMLLARADAALGEPVSFASADSDYEIGLSAGLLDLAIAHVLTAKDDYAEQAARILRAAAQRQSDLAAAGKTVQTSQLTLAHVIPVAAWVYDLLHDLPCLSDSDRQLIEETLLRRGIEALRGHGHLTCSNIRTWSIAALLAVGLCLDDRGYVHEALYGRFDEDRNRQTFGILHQFSHDILADGFHWERSFSYHYYTLSAMTDTASMAANCGIDLWRLEVDALLRPEGHDHHRDYRPACRKTLKWMYDAPFYFAFTDGSCPEIHDSAGGLVAAEWYGPMYEVAYEVYGDPKYAWLLNRIYEHRLRSRPAEDTWQDPRSWQGSRFPGHNWQFVKLGVGELPAGEFSLEQDAQVGFTGRHVKGSTLLPSAGYAVLRADVRDANAPCATLVYGPHSAGHQHSCALHVSLYGQQRQLLVDGAGFGYENLMHLTWSNQTLAHNTIVVDETSMFPQLDHEEQNYQFEADTYHLGPMTDGVLECFHSGDRLKVARASNASVYRGVRLDRTVAIVDARYLVDVFRVVSAEEHQYDFPTHGNGDLVAGTCRDVQGGLGDRLGYRHLSDIRRVVLPPPWEITWRSGEVSLTAYRIAPRGSEMFVASEPTGERAEHRQAAIVRTRGKSVVFINVFEPRRGPADILSVKCERYEPECPVAVRVARLNSDDLLVFMPADGHYASQGLAFDGQVALARLTPSGPAIIEVAHHSVPPAS